MRILSSRSEPASLLSHAGRSPCCARPSLLFGDGQSALLPLWVWFRRLYIGVEVRCAALCVAHRGVEAPVSIPGCCRRPGRERDRLAEATSVAIVGRALSSAARQRSLVHIPWAIAPGSQALALSGHVDRVWSPGGGVAATKIAASHSALAISPAGDSYLEWPGWSCRPGAAACSAARPCAASAPRPPRSGEGAALGVGLQRSAARGSPALPIPIGGAARSGSLRGPDRRAKGSYPPSPPSAAGRRARAVSGGGDHAGRSRRPWRRQRRPLGLCPTPARSSLRGSRRRRRG